MSVRERVEDAQLLYQANRPQGALLSILVATAATARKRRPKGSDSVAFQSFVGEEMLAITSGAVKNFYVRFRKENDVPLQRFFYKFLRCELAHEARLPVDVWFFPQDKKDTLTIDIEEHRFGLSHSWMDGLAKAVKFAPENASEFPETTIPPDDVLKWLLFGVRRESEHVPGYWESRARFAAKWQKRLASRAAAKKLATKKKKKAPKKKSKRKER